MMHNNAVEQEREELAIRLNFDPFTSRRGGGGAPLVRARPAIRSIQIIFYIRHFSSDISLEEQWQQVIYNYHSKHLQNICDF